MDPEQKKIQNAENKKKWAENNPKKIKIAAWKQKMKLVNSQGDRLTMKEWGELYDKWILTETCECCGKTFDQVVKNKSFNDKQIDHCHKTNKFRNILCNKCNKIRAYVDNDYKIIMKLMTM